MEDFKIVKQFSLAQKDNQYFCTISRRETPETETGLTWEVLAQTNTEKPVLETFERYSIAEMAFKNYVVEALNTDHFYQYRAEKQLTYF